ncbi:hypothetical protein [Streptomyces sp. CMB-StM0423]|uniref:hypothetical protein n=1 Tax=Streptomyces sp. CMB-StM0423 TaxID=2059884 RepID=UPI000C7113AD|nr:hypothetical protein [Streptomyces sp. CMB-StM0423]AUH42512.1 hypothetical protein CXR04_22065 [Streptomyces sp. CMB-StM0423]
MPFHPCTRGHARRTGAAAPSLLCDPCIRQVGRHLRELAGLHRECLYQASPTAPTRWRNPTKVSTSRRLDYPDISLLDTRQRISSLLESWSGTVVAKRRAAAPKRSVPHLAVFLAGQLDWITAQPAAADFADEVEALVKELRQTIDPEPGGYFTLVEECVQDGCGGTITASLRAGEPVPVRSIACSAGHAWAPHEWLLLGQLVERQRKGSEA